MKRSEATAISTKTRSAEQVFKDVDLVESRQDLTKSPRTITFEVTCRFEV